MALFPSEVITSAQNPRVQMARALLEQPKARRKQAAFVAEGARLVEDGVRSDHVPQFVLYKSEHSKRVAALLDALLPLTPCFSVEDKLFDSLADTESTQGVLAVFHQVSLQAPEDPNFVLILDQLRDPGNLGTILRASEAAGVQAVVLPPGTVDAWSPKVVRSAMGAHFRLPIFSWGWETITAFVQGLAVFKAEMNGERSMWETDFTLPMALLVGGEAEGVSPQGNQLATASVRIPMVGKIESLNAAISASILMFEVLRQRSERLNP